MGRAVLVADASLWSHSWSARMRVHPGGDTEQAWSQVGSPESRSRAEGHWSGPGEGREEMSACS